MGNPGPPAVTRDVPSTLHLVRAQIADAIVAHAEGSIHAELIRLLARPGYALHPQSRCRAGVFALEVHRAARRSFDRTTLLVAAAVELQRQSGFLAAGLAAADPSLAMALLVAATATAADASGDAPDPAATLRHFRAASTLEDTLRLTRLESGALGRFAAGFAVRAAGAEPAGAALFERLGFNLFTFAHLTRENPDARDGSSFVAILALACLGRAHADLHLLAARGYAVEALGRVLHRVESEG